MSTLGFVPSVGQKVYFGRSHGEQTLGEVVKVNRARAKVKQLESRGTFRSHPIGTVWTVPFTLITPAPSDASPTPADPQAEIARLQRENAALRKREAQAAVTAMFPATKRADSVILREIADVYGALSPENLTCDGELSRSAVARKSAALNRRLRALFAEIGRKVSEGEAINSVMSTEPLRPWPVS